jgi:hypothetical protein
VNVSVGVPFAGTGPGFGIGVGVGPEVKVSGDPTGETTNEGVTLTMLYG